MSVPRSAEESHTVSHPLVLALEYERRQPEKNLQGFFDSSLPKINHAEVRQWGSDLLREREEEGLESSKR